MKASIISVLFVLLLIGIQPATGGQSTKSHLIVIEDSSQLGVKNPVLSIGEALIWNNRTTNTPLQILIENYTHYLSPHPLTRGFTVKDNSLVTYSLVIPGNVVSYYFSNPGKYSFRIVGENLSYNGTITVED